MTDVNGARWFISALLSYRSFARRPRTASWDGPFKAGSQVATIKINCKPTGILNVHVCVYVCVCTCVRAFMTSVRVHHPSAPFFSWYARRPHSSGVCVTLAHQKRTSLMKLNRKHVWLAKWPVYPFVHVINIIAWPLSVVTLIKNKLYLS